MLNDLVVYDFSEFEESFRLYEGSNGKKIGIIDDEDNRYLLKINNNNNDIFSEYISCHIFNMLDVNAQKTYLGTYNGLNSVACKDFCYPNLSLYNFISLKNSCINSSGQGSDTRLSTVLSCIDMQNKIDANILMNHFWKVFVVDAFIGNFDRHNGNWGILGNEAKKCFEIAPIYDCGSSLLPNASDEQIKMLLNNESEMQNRIFVFPNSALKDNDEKKINYFKFLTSTDNYECNLAITEIVPNIKMDEINSLIEKTPLISNLQKDFYQKYLSQRKTLILDRALEKANKYLEAKDREFNYSYFNTPKDKYLRIINDDYLNDEMTECQKRYLEKFKSYALSCDGSEYSKMIFSKTLDAQIVVELKNEGFSNDEIKNTLKNLSPNCENNSDIEKIFSKSNSIKRGELSLDNKFFKKNTINNGH